MCNWLSLIHSPKFIAGSNADIRSGTAWFGGAIEDVEAEAVLVGGATVMGEMVRMEPCGRHKSP